MKILVLTKRQYMGKDLLDDRFGRFREFPLELAKLGHEVTGVCLSYRRRTKGLLKDSDPDSSASVSWLGLNLGHLVIPGLIRYWFEVKTLVKNFRPDLIWACSDAFHVVFGVWIAGLSKTKCVVDLYDNFEAFPATRLTGILPLFKQALQRADGVTCFSKRLTEHILQHYGRKNSIAIIESGVRTDLFYRQDRTECRRRLGLPQDARIIGTAGALSHNRNTDTLFRGFELLAAQDNHIHLAIAGPRERGIKIPNGARVHDFGNLPLDKVPLLINALDVAVSCYRDSEIGRYSFPQKVYEIMACQTPIVSAAVGTMIDLLLYHPECLFEPDNPESLAQAVRLQLRKPTRTGHKIPSWSDVANQLERYFLDIVKARK
jgi:teichuronic acid biosynthesis glycosyltransferase TuaC